MTGLKGTNFQLQVTQALILLTKQYEATTHLNFVVMYIGDKRYSATVIVV